jgi:hypothetical protein
MCRGLRNNKLSNKLVNKEIKKNVSFDELSPYSVKRFTYRDEQVRADEVQGKCKAIPLQALTGPEDSRRLKLPDFKTIGT